MTADDRGPEVAVTIAVFLGLSAITLTLRCYVRAHILKVFRIEDWLAILTMACFVIYCTFAMLSISHGSGKRMEDVPIENIPKVLKMRWAGELAYVITSLLAKFTVGIFLLRICSATWQKVVICAALLLCFLYQTFFVFMAAFQCRPVQYYWLRYTTEAEGTCWSNDFVMGATYAGAAINAVTDWVLGLLPIAIVKSLQLSTRSKVLVSCTLALGSIASTATIVRIPYIWQLTRTTDLMHDFTDLSIWSTIENGLGLVASSVATLRPLFRMVFGGTRAGTPSVPSRKRRSFYSWRKSGTVAGHHNRSHSHHSDSAGYYRMNAFYFDKKPEPARLHDGKDPGFK